MEWRGGGRGGERGGRGWERGEGRGEGGENEDNGEWEGKRRGGGVAGEGTYQALFVGCRNVEPVILVLEHEHAHWQPLILHCIEHQLRLIRCHHFILFIH